MGGKCPKCEKIVSYVNLVNLPIHVDSRPTWVGVSYQCPYCSTVLGVGIDPIAIKNDLIAVLKK